MALETRCIHTVWSDELPPCAKDGMVKRGAGGIIGRTRSASSRRPDRARKQLAKQCTTIIDISIFVFIATAVASSAVAAAFRV